MLPRRTARLLLSLLAGGLACLAPAVPAAGAAPDEVRGLWVVRSSLRSPVTVERVVEDAARHGFNTLLVQVRGRGDAYYDSPLEPRAAGLAQQPSAFDPLALLIERAHAAGLAVHGWVNVNLVASAVDLPASSRHVVNRHPEWVMVPRVLVQELAATPVDSPAYIGRIARWTRAQSNVEGLYTTPLVPAAADHVVTVVSDLMRRYPLDGVHLDYVRFPSPDFDYSRAALAEFRASVLPDLAPAERERLERTLAVDPFAYVDFFPTRWGAFRRSRLTALVMRLRTAAQTIRPGAFVSAAVYPDATEAATLKLQDWRLWAEGGLLDAVCPMAYTTDRAQFLRQITDAARVVAPGVAVWAGIGAYRLPPADTIANIGAARSAGAAGFLLFSYDSLVDPAASAPDYLGQIRRAVAAEDASTAGMR